MNVLTSKSAVTDDVNSDDLTIDSTRTKENYNMASTSVQNVNSTTGIMSINSEIEIKGNKRLLKFEKFETSESTNDVNSEDLALESTRKTKQNIATTNVQFTNCTADIMAVNSEINFVYPQSPKIPDISEFQVPPCITTFCGREDEMKELTSLFFVQNHKKVVICGQAGIGKTETAKQFAVKSLKDKHIDKIFWINAEGKKNIEASFEKLAKHCNVPDTDVNYIFVHYKTFKCLYIFDNAELTNQIECFMPEDQLVLLTSQVKSWKADYKRIELSSLTAVGALQVVKSILAEHYKEEYKKQYRQLADIVSNVPLGLQVIAGYLYEYECNGISIDIEDYIDDLNKSIIGKPICSTLLNKYEYSIYGAVSLTLDKMHNYETPEKLSTL